MQFNILSRPIRSTINRIAFAGGVVGIVAWIWSGPAAALATATLVLVLTSVVVVAGLYGSWLQSRIDTPQSLTWDVLVNGVRVGQLGDSEYAACALVTFKDWRVYLDQLSNLGTVAGNVLVSYLVGMPLTACWLALFCVLADPQVVHDQAQALAAQSPATIGELTRQLLMLLLYANTLALAVGAYFGSKRFGFADKFFARTAFEVRQRLDLAVDGVFDFRRSVHARLHHNTPLTKEN